jgi:hypothetical protein
MKCLLASMLMMSLCGSAFAVESNREKDKDKEVSFRCEFQDPGYAAGKKTGANQCWVRGRADIESDRREESLEGRERHRDRDDFLEIQCADGFRFFGRNVAATQSGDDIQIASERRDEKLVYLLIKDLIRHHHHDEGRDRDRERDITSADLMYSPQAFIAKRLVGRCWVDIDRDHDHGHGPSPRPTDTTEPGNGPAPGPSLK